MRVSTRWVRFASAAALILGGALSAGAQEIKFWTLNFANDSANRAFQSIVKQFEDANPGVTIKLEQRGTDEHKSALRVASGSEQAADIYFMWAGLGLGGEFVKSGLALNMAKYYDEYKWDDRFLPVALSFSKDYPGGRFGVPYTFKGEAIYYNKALFQKAGIAGEPKTYDDLLADAEKLAKARIPAFTFGGTVNWHVMRLMDVILETKCGAETHDALMRMKGDWAKEPCATQSFEEFHRWTMLEGDWLVGQLRDAKRLADFAVFPFPTGTNRLYGFAEYNYVSTKSKNPDAAAKFLDFLSSTPVQQTHLGEFGTISVNKHVEYTSAEPLEVAWRKIFGSYSGVFVNGDQAFPLTVTTEYWRIINQVATDSLDPNAAAGELQKFIANAK
jgi:raffinose/stachyose/melibiose transport system substrate-binding protein